MEDVLGGTVVCGGTGTAPGCGGGGDACWVEVGGKAGVADVGVGWILEEAPVGVGTAAAPGCAGTYRLAVLEDNVEVAGVLCG